MAYEDPQGDSIAHTVGRLIDDVRELFREEVALARAELRQEVSAFGAAAAAMGAGAVAFAMLVGWPAWGGYIAMAVVLGIVAAVGLMGGRKKVHSVQMPQTVESIKETKEWMKDRMSSEKR